MNLFIILFPLILPAMLPRRSMPLGSSLSLPYSPGIRRTHVLYLALLLVVASALGSWIHQYTARSLSPAQGLSVGLPQRLLTPDPASAPALDAARMEHLDGRLDGLQQQLSQLASSLAASSSAASTGSAAAAPPAAPQPAAPAHSAPAARPMVLGMAKGLDAAGVYRFVRSLRTHSPSVDIVIFTDQATLASNELLPWVYKEYGVTVQLFEVAQLPPQLQGYHPSSYRWVLMRDYMRALPAPTGPVFFADVRDTVFQGDLFARLQGQGEPVGFYAFQEQRPGTIAACGWNSGWVKDCFGAEGLSKVGGNVISCSGTSLAGWQDALAYVELMAKTLEDMPHCERNGIDQGMHNYFVYGGALEAAVSKLHLVSNEEGFIATVQSMPVVHRDAAGRVLNAQGAPVAAVHQYDRSPALERQYAGEFPLPLESERHTK